MRKTLGFVSALALMAGLAASATGPQSANAVERASAINATTNNYAVIAPTFYSPGQNSPNSYIRFFSAAGLAGSSTTSTFSITIVGNNSGATYGSSFNLTIPRLASIQYDIAELVSRAGVTPGTFNGGSGDTSYVVYVQNSDNEAGYMHAVYDWSSQLFENMSMCGTNINQQMIANKNMMVLTNLHTSVGPNKIGQNFPSTIRIHNYYNVPINYTITVFNAGTQTNGTISANAGTQICQLQGNTVGANATLLLPVSTIEANTACSSITSADYLNVTIADVSGGAPNAVPSHTIFVSQYGGNTSMTPTCAVNAVSTSTGGGGGGGIISPYL